MRRCANPCRLNPKKSGIFWRISVCGLGFILAAQVASADEITSSDLEALPKADIYVLGEVHDNVTHHENQARAIAAIAPSALVFEMLSSAQADAAQDVDRLNPGNLEQALSWNDSGWPSFSMYYPIFKAAPLARLYGAAVPRDAMSAAIANGAAAQFGPQSMEYGLSVPLETSQQDRREAMQADVHCGALPEDMLPGMVEAQRLRDASFARTALRALSETGGPVVVITGNGHARTDWGVPYFLKRAAPEISVLSVGQVYQGQDFPPFDLWLFTQPTPNQDDPCAAFDSK